MELTGKLCKLVPFNESHLSTVRAYLSDREVMRNISTLDGGQAERFLSWLKRKDTSPAAVFSVVRPTAGEKEIVGITLLRFVDASHKRAVSGTILGTPKLWGSGLAYEAAVLKLDYGFKTLNLERVYASATDGNERGKKLIAHLGYRKLAARPDGIKDNRHPNRNFYELSREEWLTSHP